MDLPALDDNAMAVIVEHLPLRDVGNVFIACRAWRDSLEGRDQLWLAILDTLEARWRAGGARAPAAAAAGGAADGGGRRAPTPERQSKRRRQSGKQRLASAIRARVMRSLELSTVVTHLLRSDRLTVGRLRKEIRSRSPINIDVKDFSGFSILHLVYAFAPSRWLALAQELLKNHSANVNTSDLDGMTPLMVASANGATKGVKLLLEYNAVDGLGWVGAHPEGFKKGAAGSGMSAEVWAAHPMSKRYNGKHTAQKWAELYQHAACQKLLIKAAGAAGAEPHGDQNEDDEDQQEHEEEQGGGAADEREPQGEKDEHE